jgi:transposase
VIPAVTRLAEIPGISENLARAVIAETGLDMRRFPTAGHLVSWAGLCPTARQCGPRTRAGKKGQGNTWLRGHLGQAAAGAARTATFLGERYHRIARRRGKAKAQVAVARSILVIIWHLLADPSARYTDLGYGYYQDRTDKDRKLRNHMRQIEALGFTVTLNKTAYPIPPLTRPDHRTRTGSAAARPFTVGNFPVSSGSRVPILPGAPGQSF